MKVFYAVHNVHLPNVKEDQVHFVAQAHSFLCSLPHSLDQRYEKYSRPESGIVRYFNK
jgi:hypothetical protein